LLSVLDEPLAADLEGLFRQRRSALVGAVAAITNDRDLAADAVDEAFTRAFARRARVEAMASPSAWVLTVALNHVRKGRRRGARRRQAEERSVGYAGRPWIEPHDPRHELWAAVARLPERERTAVALRYLADLTEPQVADVMGIAPGTVGASLTSARRKLAAALEPRVPTGEDEHA
jgi:RNA polymerase sigma factor (sigma-70 family)